MLSRVVSCGVAADARLLASNHLVLSVRTARTLTSRNPYLIRIAAPVASSLLNGTLCIRSYATTQPTRRKAAGTQRKPATPRTKTATKTSTTKAKKRKPAKKAAAKKRKPVARKKKQPSELELKRAKVRDLKKVALLKPPKQLPQSAYLVYVVEQSQKGSNAVAQAKEIAGRFKNLPASEVEHFQNIAEQNKRSNELTIKNWIESHTPDEIRVANNARRQLSKIAKEPKPAGALRALFSHPVNKLHDSRVPVKYDTPFIGFTRDRWASGDFSTTAAADAAKIIGKEWKALSTSAAQKYHDSYASNKAKYDQEYDRLFTRSSPRKA